MHKKISDSVFIIPYLYIIQVLTDDVVLGDGAR